MKIVTHENYAALCLYPATKKRIITSNTHRLTMLLINGVHAADKLEYLYNRGKNKGQVKSTQYKVSDNFPNTF